MEGSQQIVKLLSERYEVFVTSAAMDHPNSFAAKYSWLKEHFPFIPDKRIVFCGDKSIIRADFMIDDNEQNLAAFTGKGFIFSAPHNLLHNTFPPPTPSFHLPYLSQPTPHAPGPHPLKLL